jgi:hypothetical protein
VKTRHGHHSDPSSFREASGRVVDVLQADAEALDREYTDPLEALAAYERASTDRSRKQAA